MQEYASSQGEISLKVMNGFYQLVKKKDFIKLTVTEICEAAGVSRKTFYKYFKDKNDIIEQILIKDLVLPTEKLRELYKSMELPEGMILEWQYEHFYKERDFYQCISSFTGQNSFFEFIMKYSTNIITRKLMPSNLSDVELEYMTYFYASSHAMLLVKWINDGMIIPPKQIASYYERWTIPIFKNYEGLNK
jgi:AcrR family transcriptional regulator